ncbi:hypothetical protein CTEN210_11840 [Chaetoceros tenuissimus]|uniref:HSF-type DNA-binding domain-containing protein n=1 Tax=Chaetoceros tenuissimus TaxID=426638 RepID=A0AAD3D3F0_9STRA|nr:hypothetical protein CTEN210_11840 [Chaetoceros tenuissimus]
MPGYYNYTDYATIDEDAYVASNGPFNKMKGGVATPFPQKLHKILDEGIHSDIISWAPHGRCFLIHQPKLFVEIVLPNFFHSTKKTSFTRQLNLYGFVRLLSKGPDKGGYYHEKFLRSKSKLCKLIKRMPLKGSEHSLHVDSEQEPKFYSMPYLPKLSYKNSEQESNFQSLSYLPEITFTTSCDNTSEASSASSPSTFRRSNAKTSDEITPLYLDQLRSNYEEAQSSFAKKKVTSISKKSNVTAAVQENTPDLLRLYHSLCNQQKKRKIDDGVIFRRLPLSIIYERIMIQDDYNRSLDKSTLRKRSPRMVTSMKSTITRRNKEPSSMSGFDSKTKFFISQFF